MKFNTRLLVTALFFIGSTANAGTLKVSPATRLPSVSSKGVVSIGETLKGHDLTIIQFWASWCVGCGQVMADLAKRTAVDSSIGYASISVDEDMETARNYFNAKPAEVRQALPNAWLDAGGAKVGSQLEIKSLPFIVIVTSDGHVVQSMQGHPKQEELTASIAKFRSQLKSKPAAGNLVTKK